MSALGSALPSAESFSDCARSKYDICVKGCLVPTRPHPFCVSYFRDPIRRAISSWAALPDSSKAHKLDSWMEFPLLAWLRKICSFYDDQRKFYDVKWSTPIESWNLLAKHKCSVSLIVQMLWSLESTTNDCIESVTPLQHHQTIVISRHWIWCYLRRKIRSTVYTGYMTGRLFKESEEVKTFRRFLNRAP